MSWCRAHFVDIDQVLLPFQQFRSGICCPVSVGRPLWREAWSVLCRSQPSNLSVCTFTIYIFFCLSHSCFRFWTNLWVLLGLICHHDSSWSRSRLVLYVFDCCSESRDVGRGFRAIITIRREREQRCKDTCWLVHFLLVSQANGLRADQQETSFCLVVKVISKEMRRACLSERDCCWVVV
jgi:hypothetical protein